MKTIVLDPFSYGHEFLFTHPALARRTHSKNVVSAVADLLKSEDHVDPANAVPIGLPLADPITEADVQHRAWAIGREAMQPGWCIRSERRSIQMSDLVATQAVVDRERVARDAEEYSTEGQDESELPLVLQHGKFYYLLAGHHHAEGAYLDGAQQLDVEVMLGAERS